MDVKTEIKNNNSSLVQELNPGPQHMLTSTLPLHNHHDFLEALLSTDLAIQQCVTICPKGLK